MGFYGNMSNAGKTEISFDKIYPNRAQMERQKDNDGVFIGRRVLIEYDDNTKPRRLGYIDDTPDDKDGRYVVYTDSRFTYPFTLTQNTDTTYGLETGDLVYALKFQHYYYFQATGEVDEYGNALFEYIIRSSEEVTDPDQEAITDYTLNYALDKNYAQDNGIEFIDGWDSTIWEKCYINGEERYIMIASLNSTMPRMTIEAEAPSIEPIPPHFSENSTNMFYTVHMATPWGFKMKAAETYPPEGEESSLLCDVDPISLFPHQEGTLDSNESIGLYYPAVYYNKAGFSPKKIVQSEVPTEFRITPTGISGKHYLTHSPDDSPIQVDMQELKIHLPEIGNTMSKIWNVVYGDEVLNGGLVRNQDLTWGNKTGLRMINTLEETGEQTFNTEVMQTLAGCINSAQDILGTNIIRLKTSVTPNEVPGGEDTIYYGPLGPDGKLGFYYKDIEYTFTSFAEKGLDVNDYTGEKQYVDLTQFEANKYYYYEGLNFYLEKNNYPEDHTPYYLLSEPEEVLNLVAWPPEDEEGKIKYPFYKEDNKYIQDKGESPKSGVTHYHIKDSQATFPLVTEDELGNVIPIINSGAVLIWNPLDQIELSPTEITTLIKVDPQELADNTINAYQKGFFALEQESAERRKLVALDRETAYNGDAEYYYFPAYALSIGSDTQGHKTESVYLPYEESLIAFEALCNNEEKKEYYAKILAQYKVTFLDFKPDTYYTKTIEKENDNRIVYTALDRGDNARVSEIYYTLTLDYVAGDIEKEGVEPQYFYAPYEYFIATSETNPNYLLSISKTMKDDTKYYHLTQLKDGKKVRLIIDPDTHLVDAVPVDIKFYIPGKYYYWSKSLTEDVLDQSPIMKTPVSDKDSVDYYITEDNKIYYLLNIAYVVKDNAGILSVGSIWNKSTLAEDGVTWNIIPPPDGVVLGVREEVPKWTELKGLAKRRNTIHGRLMDINLLFKFDDTVVRDNETIFGCMHKMKDIVQSFGKLNPGEIPCIDSYGRIISSTLEGPKLTGYSLTPDSTEKLEDTDSLLAAIKKLENRIAVLESELVEIKKLEDRIAALEPEPNS